MHKLSAHVAHARTRTHRERDDTRQDEEVPVLCAADCDKNTAITRDNAVSGGGGSSSDRVEGSGDLGEGRGEGAATLSQGWQTISACGTRAVACVHSY